VWLRRIEPRDAHTLVRWRNENAKFFRPQEPWTLQSHLSWYYDVYQHDPSDNMFMVEHEGRLAGCLAMTIKGGRGELERMILGDKTVARGGIMRAAFRQLMDAYGLEYYWLRIYEWNEVTISFHRRNGFEVTGKSDDGEYLIMTRHATQPYGGDDKDYRA
jgi:RimJ/RimL family protein N-acetyltransferase